jgi:hypothetical protein
LTPRDNTGEIINCHECSAQQLYHVVSRSIYNWRPLPNTTCLCVDLYLLLIPQLGLNFAC